MDLDQYLETAMTLPYRPGTYDCAIFVAVWADIVGGSRIQDRLKGSYSNNLEGLRKHRPGNDQRTTLASIAAEFLTESGWQQFTSTFSDGDVATFDDREIGIVWKGKGVKLKPRGRLELLPANQIRTVWKWKGGGNG